jgi:hypothetical protein
MMMAGMKSLDHHHHELLVAFSCLFLQIYAQLFVALDITCKDEQDCAFSALEMMFVAFNIAKSSLLRQKSQK